MAGKNTKAIAKLNHHHDAIAEWLVANPDKTQGACAAEFGYTEAWMSMIVNSDMFQVLYQAICEERKQLAVHTISAKMNNATALALDRTIEMLEPGKAVSERFLLDTQNSLLDRLGFSGKAERVELHEHRHVHVLTGEEIVAARERALVNPGGENG